MKLNFTYYHNTNSISYRILLYSNEEAFAIGFGETCEEAKENLRGWITRDSEMAQKQYKYDETKPFIALIKKHTDGGMVQTDVCINALEDRPTGSGDQVTVREFDF